VKISGGILHQALKLGGECGKQHEQHDTKTGAKEHRGKVSRLIITQQLTCL